MTKKHSLKLVTAEDWDELIDDVTHNAGSRIECDQKNLIAYTENMPPVSKDLLDARLEAIEARMDARVAGMSAKLDATLAEMRADREADAVRFASISETFQHIKSDIQEIKTDVKDQGKNLKSTIWFAAATTIASVLAAWALAFSAFDSGRETSKSIAEANVRMEKLQAQLEAQAKAAANTPIASQK